MPRTQPHARLFHPKMSGLLRRSLLRIGRWWVLVPRRPRNEALAIELGRRVRDLRLARHLSQEELAHRCDAYRTYVSTLENGRIMPSIEVLVTICRVLDVTISDFLDGLESTLDQTP